MTRPSIINDQIWGSHVDCEEYMDDDDGDEEEYQEYKYSDECNEETSYSCDTCERDFYSKGQFDKHMSEHRTCNLEGCTFTAHEKIIEKHIRMQHSTGLFGKIKNLNTPDDIAKWVEERRKNYPSKENVEKRYQRQEELIKKGIRIQKNSNQFGRDKFRLAAAPNRVVPPLKRRTTQPMQRKRKRGPPLLAKTSLINQQSDWNGSMFPFRGTSELIKSSVVEDEISDFEDDMWQENAKAKSVKINKSLGCLMAAYGSDSEDGTEEPTSTKCSVVSNNEGNKLNTSISAGTKIKGDLVNGESDNEPPLEIKTPKAAPEDCLAENENSNSAAVDTSHGRGNKFSRKRSHARSRRFGNRSHFDPSEASTSTDNTRRKSDNFPHNNFRRRKVTLLEKLLEKEIRHERNVILQCVHYVVENNFFKE